MPDLFISHSSADAETARALVTDFENRGISCWVAPRDIPMGSSYQSEIVSAIERCRAMLLLFSGATNDSEHVLREVELAAQGRKAIYPLRIDSSEPAGGLRYMLANKQWVERKALGNRLIDTIEQLLANAGPPRDAGAGAPPRPAAPTKPNRLPIYAGAGALVVALVAGVFAMQGVLSPPKAPLPSPSIPSRPELPPTPSASVDRQKAADAVTSSPAAIAPPAAPVQPLPAAVPPAQPPAASADSQPPANPPEAKPPVVEARLPAERVVPPASSAPPQIANIAPARGEAESKTFFRECDLCPVMVVVPAGSNLIGSPDDEKGRESGEGRQQPVTIRASFAVGRTEVLFEEWLACVAEGGCNAFRPSDYEWGADTRPVINVSWNDAKAYVDWLSKKLGATYRLLSEAEWEYAARGCAKVCESTPFWFGGDISRHRANYDWRYAYDGSPKAQPPRRTVPADGGEANPFGLLHVHGNVREWVEDCWNESIVGVPKDGSARTSGDCRSHVLRGGSWADEPKDLRSAKRNWDVSASRRAQNGFRVARDLQP